ARGAVDLLPVGGRQVELAVAVEVPRGHPARVAQHRRPDDASLEGAVAVAQQDGVTAAVRRGAGERGGDVELAVAVEVADRPAARIGARDGERGRVDARLEGAIAVAEQDDGRVARRRRGQKEVELAVAVEIAGGFATLDRLADGSPDGRLERAVAV